MNILTGTDPALDMTNWVMNYINDNCIYRVAPDEEQLPGLPEGNRYTWQFYMRRGLTNPRFLKSIGSLFWFRFAQLYKSRPFQITGLETGATPLIIGIVMTAHAFNIDPNCFITRAERKKYGLKNRFEGIVDYDLPVLIVDDLSNSKDSMVRAMVACEQEGLEIYKYGFTIINKGADHYDKYIGIGLEIFSLFQYDEFIMQYEQYQEYCKLYNVKQKPFRREQFAK